MGDAEAASTLRSHVRSIAGTPDANAKTGKLKAFENHIRAQTGEKVTPAAAALPIGPAGAL